jgi:hypothetical protein
MTIAVDNIHESRGRTLEEGFFITKRAKKIIPATA